MFTGIVEELGTVEAVEDQGDAIRLTVRAATVLEDAGLGDSISVNGCCLTVVDATTACCGPPTSCRRRSTRPACRASSPATGSTSSAPSPPRSASAATSSRATSTPSATSYAASPASTGRSSRSRCPRLGKYLVDKGSITVDGVSLTVVEAGPESFTVSLIPETLARTTLGLRQPGDRVNLEVDVLAKHVEKLLAARLAADQHHAPKETSR